MNRAEPGQPAASPGLTQHRRFLFLQGLATPFFARLGAALAAAGQSAHRVNFNGGDRLFWPLPGGIDFRDPPAAWPGFVDALFERLGITDLLLFGDCRPRHAIAIAIAEARGIAVHVVEEAYLRPGYITLERNGVNGHSRLPRDPDWYRAEARRLSPRAPPAPVPAYFLRRAADDVRYNLAIIAWRHRFPHWRTHRAYNIWREYLGWVTRGLLRPWRQRRGQRDIAALAASGRPYWVMPLQLEGDYQLRRHSPFASMRDAILQTALSFARAAPAGARLVFKGHPLDNGVEDWGRVVRAMAATAGIAERVDWVAEARFSPLLDGARGVVTVNSTAGLQALGEGKPVLALGTAIYALPGLTFQHGLDRFWTEGMPPDAALLEDFRRVLVARCLIEGGLFSAEGLARAVPAALARLGVTSVAAPWEAR